MRSVIRKTAYLGVSAFALNILLYDRYPRSLNLYSYEVKNRNRNEEMWLSAGNQAHQTYSALIKTMKEEIKRYSSPAFCWNPHISLLFGQTKLGTSYGNEAAVKYSREYLDTLEGKIAFDISYAEDRRNIVLIVPGVSGASSAGYCLEAVFQLNKHGYTVVVINHIAPRDGEKDLRLLNFSNSQALKETVVHIKSKFGSDCRILGIGFSMGGNHLIRYLGDYKTSVDISGLHAAMTIGNPFDVLATGL